MKGFPPLRFITQEDGLTIFNATDEDGVLRKFILNPDQETWCALDLMKFALTRRGNKQTPDL